jgi:hypothetical protein
MRLPDPELLPKPWAYVFLSDGISVSDFADVALAIVFEPEGVTIVLPYSVELPAETRREGPFAAIRLNLQTSLQESGITAAISQAWTEEGIPCNVIAGFFHDVFLCPWEDRERALSLVHEMRLPGQTR